MLFLNRTLPFHLLDLHETFFSVIIFLSCWLYSSKLLLVLNEVSLLFIIFRHLFLYAPQEMDMYNDVSKSLVFMEVQLPLALYLEWIKHSFSL